MNKLLTKVVGVALGTVMALGTVVAIESSGQDVVAAHAATNTYEKVSSLVDGDEVLITTLKDSKYYYLPTTNGSSSAPTASTITIADNKITGDYDSHLFKLVADSTNWKFQSVSNDSNYLYTTSSNNGIRIGTKTNNIYTVTSTTNGYKMQNVATSRYVGLYNTQDWRSYTSSNFTNYGSTAESINFYKKVSIPIETYTVSFNANGGTGTMNDISGLSGSYTLPESTFVAPLNKAFAGWKANNAGDTIAVGDSYPITSDVTFYAQWADSYDVTYSAGVNGTGSYVHSNQPSGEYTLLSFADLTGIFPDSEYSFLDYSVNGVNKNPGETITLNASTSITVNFEVKPSETTYDFTTKFATYAKEWNGYSTHEGIDGKTDLGGEYAATIDLYYVSKQNGTITNMPVFASKTAKGSYTKVLQFTLKETAYKIKEVVVTFAQWTTKTPSIALYKGNDISGTPLDTATIGTKNTLNVSDLNGLDFAIGYSDGDTKNVQSGISSIYITLVKLESFGTLDHISVTSLPKTFYHVGESYSSEGLTVVAYDSADEDTANFKVVTDSSDLTILIDEGHEFSENDVPGFDVDVEYVEGSIRKETSFHIDVYALAEYELVTAEPTSWSGNYIIVSTKSNELVAMNGALSIIDVENNYEVVTEKATNVIEAGQELEWTISATQTGYSIQGKSGKYIDSLTTDKNGIKNSDVEMENTLSIDDSGNVSIAGTNGNTLKYNSAANKFRYYTSSSTADTSTVKLYKLKESNNSDSFAQTFLSAFTCDGSGTNKPSFALQSDGVTSWSWALLEAEYNKLSNAEKEQFRIGVADKNGTNIQQAIARYDYIVGKYFKTGLDTSFTDFMNRDPVSISSSRVNVLSSIINNDDSMISIVVIISLLSIIGVSSYFFIRRRKEQQ